MASVHISVVQLPKRGNAADQQICRQARADTRGQIGHNSRMNPSRYDVIVVGAGIVGSSIAMGLAQRGRHPLAIDIDLSGRLSSSEKNAGGVRATWWEAVNIALCRASIDYYESVANEVGFRQKGYLWLYDEETWPKALAHI